MFFLLIFLATKVFALGVDDVNIEKLASSIYKAEGGEKTRFPYGIKSVKCSSKAECKKICINSIKNNIKRYKESNQKGDFIEFMGRRYSPPDKNPNWVRLVTYFYNK